MHKALVLSATLALSAATASGQALSAKASAPEAGSTKPELVLQASHTSRVLVLAVSPDARLVASGAADGQIKLWDARSGHVLRTFVVPDSEITCLSFSRDSQTIFSGDSKGRIQAWDIRGGRKEGAFDVGFPVLAIYPNEARNIVAAYAQFAGIIRWHRGFDLLRDETLNKERGFTDELASFDPAGRWLALADKNGHVVLRDAQSGQVVREFAGSSGKIEVLGFSHDGELLAAGYAGQAIKLWEVGTGIPRLTRKLEATDVTAIAFDENASLLATGNAHSLVQLWDLNSGNLRKSFPVATRGLAGTYPIRALAFTPGGNQIAVGSHDSSVRLFDVAATQELWGARALNDDVYAMSLSPEGRWFGLSGTGTFPRFWNAAAGFPAIPPAGNITCDAADLGPQALAFASGNRLATASSQGNLCTWALPSFNRLAKRHFDSSSVTSLAVAVDGRRFAVGMRDGQIHVVPDDLTSDLFTLTTPGEVRSLAFSLDGLWLAAASESLSDPQGHGGNVTLWDLATGKRRAAFSSVLPIGPDAVAFSPDQHWFLFEGQGLEARSIPDGSGRRALEPWGGNALAFGDAGRLLAFSIGSTIEIMDLSSSRTLELKGHNETVHSLMFYPQSRLLISASSDSTVRIWDDQTGEPLATFFTLGRGEDWVVTTPDGLFDGSPGAWRQILWRFNNDTFDVAPVEIFFNEDYYPGLLADILAGKRPKAASDITQKDRRQPRITLALNGQSQDDQQGSVGTTPSRTVTVKLELAEAPPDKDHPRGSGVQDLRLFRNGSLVKMWHGAAKLDAQGRAVLKTSVRIVAGENQFTAYAFNHDNIKSSDATLTVTGEEALKRRGTAYILAVGVDQYANKDFNLRYAVADAQAFAQELKTQQEKLANFARVEVIPLLDAQATRANILAAFAQLAPNPPPLLAGAPPELGRLQAAQPEDVVFIYFAGHGTSDGARFFLIPHDLGYEGARDAIDAAAMTTITQHSISDEELDAAFENVDAGRMVLVIDACNSGQALETEEKRRGPMNSKGLAQLAYEKGMYILTAAQGYQQAKESGQLGHGLLTYALVEEGLKQGKAAAGQPNVYLREWLDYAVQEVPQLQMAWLEGRAVRLKNGAKAGDPLQLGMQRPRIFYRREPETQPLVIAKVAAKP